MKNKYSTFAEIKNRVLTPEQIKEALNNLPFNFIKLTIEVLTQWKSQGEIEKIYSDRYITAVKNGEKDYYNEEIMYALAEVGLNNLKTISLFPGRKKKTSKTN